jgi:putative NIF3 family GTP cyclohydrolase 1 type 2
LSAPFVLTRRPSAAAVTAADVVDRIRKNIGVEWRADTVDAIRAGDPATVVSGIVTTAMASMRVLRQAVDGGANLVITCEPTFYARSDARSPAAGRGGGGTAASPASPGVDPVYAAKNAFIEKHGLVVFRLSEHWRLRKPDPFCEGLARVLGWTRHAVAADVSRYALPAVALEALAGEIKKTLASRGGMRVVGERRRPVRTVALLPGATAIAAALDTLPSVDVIVAGEVREWESVEYARDAAFSGRGKGLVLIGRVVSEEGGMSDCARWIATLVSEVPVRHVAAGDPYWRPA